MNYTELKDNIQDITEYTFTDAQLAMFVQQAEQKLYNSVQLPAMHKAQTGLFTANTPFLTIPSDYLFNNGLAVIVNGKVNYLVYKDYEFIREAFPDETATGIPKYYSQYDKDSFIVGPTPDSAYQARISYGYYPESIVTAGNTWLGDEFDSALLNGALLEAARFMKSEPDLIAAYEKMYAQSVGLLKNLGDGKLRQDTFRSGQFKSPVS